MKNPPSPRVLFVLLFVLLVIAAALARADQVPNYPLVSSVSDTDDYYAYVAASPHDAHETALQLKTYVLAASVLTTGSYANPSWITSLAFGKITGTPTTLSGYGVTDPVVLTSGTYADPAWVTSLSYSKLTGVPAFALLASPALTGVPTAPTAAPGTSTTQIATTAFVNTNYVAGTVDALGSPIITPPSGTVSSVIIKPNQNLVTPNLALRNGPQSGYIVCYGDSLTFGIGSSLVATSGTYYGPVDSYPGELQAMSFGLAMSVFNLGISGIQTGTANTDYAQGAVDSTITTNGTTTATVTGSTTGIPSSGYLASQYAPVGTTYTLSGTTLTLSVAATGTGTSKPASFLGTPLGAGYYPNYTGTAHWLSPAITGHTAYADLFPVNLGTNDIYVGGITSSGTATNAGATISAMTISTGLSVGGAALTATSGYNVWGSSDGVTFVYLGAVASNSSSSVTLASGSAVLATMTTFKLCPALTTVEASYTALVNKALTDSYTVMVESIIPDYNSGYAQGQYQENRALFNAWLQSTFAAGAFSAHVYFADVGSLPQFQSNSSVYFSTNQPHLTGNGYAQWANYVNAQLSLQLSTQLVNFLLPFSRYGLNASWLPSVAARTDQANAFTGGDQTVGQSVGTYRTLNIYGNISMLGSNNNGNAKPQLILNGIGDVPSIIMQENGTSAFILKPINSSSASIALNSAYTYGGLLFSYAVVTDDDGFTVNSVNGGYSPLFTLSNNNGTNTDIFNLTSTALTVNGNNGAGTWLSVNNTTGAATMKAVSSTAFNSSAPQTTVAGSTAGTAVFAEPFQGTSYKMVTVHCAGLNGTATYNPPAVFTNTPVVIFASSGITASTLGTGTITLSTSGATSGFVEIAEQQ
jgi:hypothetical protein